MLAKQRQSAQYMHYGLPGAPLSFAGTGSHYSFEGRTAAAHGRAQQALVAACLDEPFVEGPFARAAPMVVGPFS